MDGIERARRAALWFAVRIAPARVLRACLWRGIASSGRARGAIGEELAARHLASRGVRLIGRNVRAPEAELDLVGIDGDTLVVVEVKTGRGRPGDRLGRHARRKRCEAARRLRRTRRDLRSDRVDLVEVIVGKRGVVLRATVVRGRGGTAHATSRPAT